MEKEKQVIPKGFRALKNIETHRLYDILLKYFDSIPVGCCPKSFCKSMNIYKRIKEKSPNYLCGECGYKFDYPKTKWT
jgi:hypothetical protein